jgi:peroxiredoxin
VTLTAPGLRVSIGDQLPSVGLRATDGYLLNLRSFVARSPSIVVFFAGPSLRGDRRAAGDLMATTLAQAYPRLERAGIGLVAVTTDSEQQQAAYVQELELPYLLYCDERRTAVQLLGIPTRNERGNVNAEPTAFAISIDGEILDLVARAEPRGLVARLVEALNPPTRPCGHRSPDRCSPFAPTAPASRCESRISPSPHRRARRCGSGSPAAASATPTCTSPGPTACG